MFMASTPGLAFKIDIKDIMDAFMYVCMNDEFCADDEEGSEFRARENRVS